MVSVLKSFWKSIYLALLTPLCKLLSISIFILKFDISVEEVFILIYGKFSTMIYVPIL